MSKTPKTRISKKYISPLKKIIPAALFITFSALQLSPVEANNPLTYNKANAPYGAIVCKSLVIGTGAYPGANNEKTQRVAQEQARVDWMKKVVRTYNVPQQLTATGQLYPYLWPSAKRKRISCQYDKVDDGYLCKAQAIPCIPQNIKSR